MKILIILLVLTIVIGGKNPCIFSKEVEELFFEKRHYVYESYETSALYSFVKYHRAKKELKNVVDLNFAKLCCNIKDVCGGTVKKFENDSDGWHSFCEIYDMFEHESNFIFEVDKLELWCFTSENLTFYSEQILNTSRNFFISAR